MRNGYREGQKLRAIMEHGGPTKARCYRCGEALGHEYHEIISRGRSVQNEVARQWSYSRLICALLCSNCHTGPDNAHVPAVATELLIYNIRFYDRHPEFAGRGYEAVKQQFDLVNGLMKFPCNIRFPSREEVFGGSEEST